MKWFADITDLICAGICLAMIVVCVVCAVVRWYHMCEPYCENPRRHYPARPMVVAMLLSQLLYWPFILRPSEEHTIVYAKTLQLVMLVTFVPIIINRYFRARQYDLKKIRGIVYMLPFWAITIVGVIMVFDPDNLVVDNVDVFMIVFGAMSFVLTYNMVCVMTWLARRISVINPELLIGFNPRDMQ